MYLLNVFIVFLISDDLVVSISTPTPVIPLCSQRAVGPLLCSQPGLGQIGAHYVVVVVLTE